jgi:hypothetical protein
MASVEQIALENYPIWNRQGDEPAEKYQIFERYFLPYSKPSLLAAYKRFLSENGKDEQVCSPSMTWRNDCEVYQWRSRHESYWRAKNETDLQWREEKRREYYAENLAVASDLTAKSMEALSQFDLSDISPKDVCAMLRLSRELSEQSLGLSDLNKAVDLCHRWGLQVISPGSEPGGQVSGDSG